MSSGSQDLNRTISHEEWLRLLDRFPSGQHPWNDIYKAETVQEIGKIIGIQEQSALLQLRTELASICEAMTMFSNVMGGISPATEQLSWVRTAQSRTGNLVQNLARAGEFLPERTTDDGYDISDVERLRRDLERFQSYLAGINKASLIKRPQTIHADFQLFLAKRLTEVFITFRSCSEITRTVEEGKVRGLFPEFIRAAARPYLLVHYPKYRLNPKRYENLDRAIQEVVKNKREAERNHAAK